MKVYYDTISKKFITIDECISDFCNHQYRGDKKKYSVLVIDDTSPFYLEKIKQNTEAKQISFFDNEIE